jgi:hypothetical protein
MLDRKRIGGSFMLRAIIAIIVVVGSLALLQVATAAAQTMPFAPGQSTPTPLSTGTPMPAAIVTQNALPPPAPGPGQPGVEQIGRVAESVGHVARDTSLGTDAKAQQIMALATQFNQLVAEWQQRSASGQSAVAGVQVTQTVSPVPGAFVTPAPIVPGAAVPITNALVTPTPLPATGALPLTNATGADQLRAQIAVVAQAMNAVSLDASLSPEARVQQLNSLATQFKQLVLQLQQVGG